jgi:DAK2 domain fusion protein YloV
MTTAAPLAPSAPLRALDAAAVVRWARTGRDALEEAREEIDELNVYPVPDGDTGTNLYLTVAAAAESLGEDEGVEGSSAAAALAVMAQAALLGARGNSGVILSQMVRGLADAVAGDAAPVDAAGLGRALQSAADAAYAAVARPVEGTMLTVAREAARAAVEAGADDDGLAGVVTRAAAGARAALARTPDQLEVLRRAGVVDAGGRGVCVLMDALVSVVTGARPEPTEVRVQARPGGGSDPAGDLGDDEGTAGPAYEVMYLLDAPATRVQVLRETLAGLGDSLVVVGAEPTWNVHVHVDDVGAAVEAGVEAGRPHRIRVTHFADAARAAAGGLADDSRGVVSGVAGGGLAARVEAAGATVVRGGPGRRASTGELLDGLRAAAARDLVVLPNDPDSQAVAEAAASRARDEGLRVAVIPTRASVQALAALAVHDPDRRFEDDVVAMTAAAGHCRHGGVTVAARAAVTMAGVCQEGDVLGIVDGDFAVIGSDLADVARGVVDRMLAGGGELVTLVTGDTGDTDVEALAAAVVEHLHETRPEVDTVVYAGGQPRYPLLLGVE